LPGAFEGESASQFRSFLTQTFTASIWWRQRRDQVLADTFTKMPLD
jgi:hypothetical protein